MIDIGTPVRFLAQTEDRILAGRGIVIDVDPRRGYSVQVTDSQHCEPGDLISAMIGQLVAVGVRS